MNILSKSLFSRPNFLEKPYGWVQHTPFAFFLIEKLKPGIFVELGTHAGNSYFSFCQAVEELKLSTTCYAVDTWEGDEHASFYGKEVFERVKRINTQNFPHISYLLKMKFDDALQYFSDGSIDLLHIDGCHTYETVKHDYETWLPKLSQKGVIILHDTNVREKGFGVWRLFEEIQSQYPSFEFLHGHGLGIICVGKDVDPEFLEFVDNAKRDPYIHHFFSTLGGRILAIQEREDVQAEIQSLKRSIKQFEKGSEKRGKETAALENEIAALKLSSQELSGNLANKDERIISLEKNRDELNEILAHKEEILLSLQSERDNLQKDLFERESDVKYISADREALLRSIEQKSSNLQNLEKENQTLNEALLGQKNTLNEGQEKIRHLNELVKERKEKIDLLKKSIENREKKISEIQEKLQEQKKVAEKFRKQLNERQDDLRMIARSISWRITRPVRFVGRIVRPFRRMLGFLLRVLWLVLSFNFGKLKKEARFLKYQRIIQRSVMFDQKWYLNTYPDIRRSGLDPIEHYVRFGADEGRNPSPEFDSRAYQDYHKDVSAVKVNPFVHYILFGIREGRLSFRVTDNTIGNKERKSLQKASSFLPEISNHFYVPPKPPTVDIIVCVHNALEDVKDCLSSIVLKTSYPYRLVLVNDGSDQQTTKYLERFTETHSQSTLTTHEVAKGYTKAANVGLKASNADYSILLNSDTIVTSRWLERIIECGESNPNIGVVGPLSNAATYQSVPELFDDLGEWAVNPLPDGVTPDNIAKLANYLSKKEFPQVSFINGFCYSIKKEVIKQVGYFDEEKFPLGYGEENDYSIRVRRAGFFLAIADQAYVYHKKSKSFNHDRRKLLSIQGRNALESKYGEKYILNSTEEIKRNTTLLRIRTLLKENIANRRLGVFCKENKPSIIWLMRGPGGGGGALSIVQEANCLNTLGLVSRVAVNSVYRASVLNNYSHIPKNIFSFYENEQDLISLCSTYDIVVGTLFLTIKTLKKIHKTYSHIIPAYYIQDYEPWIINPDDKNYERLANEAFLSYTQFENMIYFAKTDWIKGTVEKYHKSVIVHKISPGLDTRIFKPNFLDIKNKYVRPLEISAMIRPSTCRRAPGLTIEALKYIKSKYPKDVIINIFGCNDDESLIKDYDDQFSFINHRKLTSIEVSNLFSKSDIFVDASVYQAFGRTGLEAMSKGCVAILPAKGGVYEYAEHNHNCLIIDTGKISEVVRALEQLINDPTLLLSLASNGITTAMRYTVNTAAISQKNLFLDAYNRAID